MCRLRPRILWQLFIGGDLVISGIGIDALRGLLILQA